MYEHFATFNELMDLGNDYQWAWNPVDEELIGNLTMDGLGWQLLNPLINLNVKERETARPHVPPDDRAHCHLWCGLAKNIALVSDQASGLLPVHRRPRQWRRMLNDTTGTCSARASGTKLCGTNSLASSARKKERKTKRENRKLRQKDGRDAGEERERTEREEDTE